MSSMKHKRIGFWLRLAVLAALLALCAVLLFKAQDIRDAIKLYGYQPPAAVADLADQTTMTDKGRKLFYVNYPTIAHRESFNQYCTSRGEQSIVLGCYHSPDDGIYLFAVDDARLNGVEQVTAAHEMLHVAYDRLSSKQRQSIDTSLQNFYDTQVQDQRIRDTIAVYQKSEPNDVVNEMHSIFATEIAQLPADLETYYRQYFTNRSRVVAYASSYQQEFTSRRDQVKAYDDRLAGIKSQLDFNKAALEAQRAEIDVMRTRMNADRSDGNLDTYNAAVPIYNARVDSYNGLIEATQGLIAEYNRIVAERNDVALQVKALAESINSQLAPIGR